MKQPSYLRCFNDKAAAVQWGAQKNESNRVPYWRWVVVEGPTDDMWCVVDLYTAIDHGLEYHFVG